MLVEMNREILKLIHAPAFIICSYQLYGVLYGRIFIFVVQYV